MSSTTHRLAAAAVAAAILAGPLASAQSAQAAPKGGHSAKPTTAGKPAKPAKAEKPGNPGRADHSQSRQLAKAVAVKDAFLARVTVSSRTTALPDDLESVVVANIDDDRAALADLAAAADARAALRALAVLRVESYVLVVGLLEDAVELQAAAADDPEAAALVQSAVDTALTVTAASPRSEVRTARQALEAAQDELDAEDELLA